MINESIFGSSVRNKSYSIERIMIKFKPYKKKIEEVFFIADNQEKNKDSGCNFEKLNLRVYLTKITFNFKLN